MSTTGRRVAGRSFRWLAAMALLGWGLPAGGHADIFPALKWEDQPGAPHDGFFENEPGEPVNQDDFAGNTVGAANFSRLRPGSGFTLPLPGNLDMVWIPPGSFVMGSPATEAGRKDNEGPLTHVTLTRGFWLSKTEVTQQEWSIMTSALHQQSRWSKYPLRGEGPEVPMYFVSWNEAMAFCDLLNHHVQLPPGYAFTLPTEAQWEYACRAREPAVAFSGNLAGQAWFAGNSGNVIHPVGQKQSNAFGLADMLGNTQEWCRDYAAKLPGGNVTDPAGPPAGSAHVARGGEFDSAAAQCRPAARAAYGPDEHAYIGFRLALEPIPGNAPANNGRARRAANQ
jgi:formylglycine-generating enzyme required for sulfatase activity